MPLRHIHVGSAHAALGLLLGTACMTSPPPLPPLVGPPKEPKEPTDAIPLASPGDPGTTGEVCWVELPKPRPFVGRPEPRWTGHGFGAQPQFGRREECFDGVVPAQHIQERLAANRGRIRHCYTDALLRDPSVAGRAVIAFGVSVGGLVRDVEVESDGAFDEEMTDCIEAVVTDVHFICGREGVRVRYPVVFQPRQDPPDTTQ
jgi:hypothetical protein